MPSITSPALASLVQSIFQHWNPTFNIECVHPPSSSYLVRMSLTELQGQDWTAIYERPGVPNATFSDWIHEQASRTYDQIPVAVNLLYRHSPDETVTFGSVMLRNFTATHESRNNVDSRRILSYDFEFSCESLATSQQFLDLATPIRVSPTQSLNFVVNYGDGTSATVTGTTSRPWTVIPAPVGPVRNLELEQAVRQVYATHARPLDQVRVPDQQVFQATYRTEDSVSAPSPTTRARYATTPAATPRLTSEESDRVSDFWDAFIDQETALANENRIRAINDPSDYTFAHRIGNREFMAIASFENLWELYQARRREETASTRFQYPAFSRKDVARAYNLFVLAINQRATAADSVNREEFRRSIDPDHFGENHTNRGIRGPLNQFNLERMQDALRYSIRGESIRANSIIVNSDEEAIRLFGMRMSSLTSSTMKKAFQFIKMYFPLNVHGSIRDHETIAVIRFIQSLSVSSREQISSTEAGKIFANLILPNPTAKVIYHNRPNRKIVLDFVWADHVNLATFFAYSPNFTARLRTVSVTAAGRLTREQHTRQSIEQAIRAPGTSIPERADGAITMGTNNIEDFVRNAVNSHPGRYGTDIELVIERIGSNRSFGALVKLINMANKTLNYSIGRSRFENWNRGRYETNGETYSSEFRIPRTTIESIFSIGNQGRLRNRSRFRDELNEKVTMLNTLAATFGCTIRTSLVQLTPETSSGMPIGPDGNTVNEIRTFRIENFPVVNQTSYINGVSPLVPRAAVEISPTPNFFQIDSLAFVLRDTLADHMMEIVESEANLFVEPSTVDNYAEEFREEAEDVPPRPTLDLTNEQIATAISDVGDAVTQRVTYQSRSTPPNSPFRYTVMGDLAASDPAPAPTPVPSRPRSVSFDWSTITDGPTTPVVDNARPNYTEEVVEMAYEPVLPVNSNISTQVINELNRRAIEDTARVLEQQLIPATTRTQTLVGGGMPPGRFREITGTMPRPSRAPLRPEAHTVSSDIAAYVRRYNSENNERVETLPEAREQARAYAASQAFVTDEMYRQLQEVISDTPAPMPVPAPTQVDIDNLQQRLDRLTQIVSEIGAERRR